MPNPTATYFLDDLCVDTTRRQVFRGGRPIPMPALSFNTLLVLVDASPKAVSLEALIKQAWNGLIVSNETVTQRIRLLRQTLGDDSQQPRYIETIRNEGYRVIPPVKREAASENRSTGWSAIAALLALLVGVLVWFWPVHNEPAAMTEQENVRLPSGPVRLEELVANATELMAQRSPESLAHAINLYEQALMLEKNNPYVQAKLSLALSRSVAWYNRPAEHAQRAERLARSSLAGNIAFDGEFALAFSLDAQGKVEPAQAAYERAVALDPSHPGARASMAYLQQVRGKLVEALSNNIIAMEGDGSGKLDVQVASCLRLLGFRNTAGNWLERADRLDPDSAHAAVTRAQSLLTRGRSTEAKTVINDAIARGIVQEELYEYLAILSLQAGDLSTALTVIASAPESIAHRDSLKTWNVIITTMMTQDAEPAIELIEELSADFNNGFTWPGNLVYLAILETVSGRREQAFEALKSLQKSGYRDYQWLRMLPPLDPIKNHHAFTDTIAIMQADVEQQRQQVLTASWLPEGISENDLAVSQPPKRQSLAE